MTALEEFTPDERLDMAADNMAAITIPANPPGKTVTTNFGNSSSACPITDVSVPRLLACAV